jgi:hypothetical protein
MVNGDVPSIFPFEESNEAIFLIQMFQDKSNLPAHGGKRRLMVPGGQLMAKNDNSWRLK